jgi:hypothetical protein
LPLGDQPFLLTTLSKAPPQKILGVQATLPVSSWPVAKFWWLFDELSNSEHGRLAPDKSSICYVGVLEVERVFFFVGPHALCSEQSSEKCPQIFALISFFADSAASCLDAKVFCLLEILLLML